MIDTVTMLYMVVDLSECIVDILFHAWVIISLTMGIVSHFKLKKLPEEPVVWDEAETVVAQEAAEDADFVDIPEKIEE